MIEYVGYAASALILISILMTSAKKLRMINLLGAILFAVYGFVLKVYPVAVMNTGIAIANIYYLYKMFTEKDYFKLLPIDKNSVYLKNFLSFYQKDVETFFSIKDVDVDNAAVSFYILRNVIPAGFFVANEIDSKTLRVDFDYVVPAYRDFKMGTYIYQNQMHIFREKGYETLITYTKNEKHETYLKKMGFKHTGCKDDQQCYTLNVAKK